MTTGIAEYGAGTGADLPDLSARREHAGGRELARPLAYVYATAAALIVVWIALPAHAQANRPALAGVAVVAALTGLALMTGRFDRATPAVFETLFAFGSLLVALTVYFSGSPTSGLGFIYVWAVPYAFWFFPHRNALAQVAWVAITYTAAYALAHQFYPAHAGSASVFLRQVIVGIATLLVVGELVRSLSRRARATSELYTRLFELSPVGMIRTDTSGRILEVNPAFCAIVQRPATDLIGRTRAVYSGSDIVDPEETPIQHAVAEGRQVVAELERELIRPDGSIRDAEVRVTSVPRTGGAAEFFSQIVDVTERRQAETALRLSEARLHSILDHAPAGITIRDAEGRIQTINLEAAKGYGRPASDLVGLAYEDLLTAEDARLAVEQHARLLATGEPLVESVSLETAAGYRSFIAVAFAIPTEPGGPQAIGRIAFDVTDRDQARSQLEHSNDLRRRLLVALIRAQEDERRRIAGDLHDDAIQLMTGVAIRLGIVADTISDPEALELLTGLDESVRASIEGLRRTLFELWSPVLEEQGLGAALELYVSETLGKDGIDADVRDELRRQPSPEQRTLLYRVAQEALANVRKHSQAGRVEVSLASSEDGFSVRVRDDGVGFEPQQVSLDRPGHLGMVGMRERIETAGGWLRVDSSPGVGTVVEFGLEDPAVPPEWSNGAGDR